MTEGHTAERGHPPADHVSLRRHNLAVVLGNLRDNGPRTRARIATDTGLNKATVSSLVAELAALGLVRDGGLERAGGIGRPGQTVEIDGRVCGLGAEIGIDRIAVLVLDLRGDEVLSTRTPLDVPRLGAHRTLDELASIITAAMSEARRKGRDVAGITVAVPGLVESAPGVLRHAPNLGWLDVPVADELAARLAVPGCPVRVDNDANLCALAEYATAAWTGVRDLICLIGESGVGSGVIAGGGLLRGTAGFAGEVGHLPIGDPKHPCACGRFGCWDTSVGLAALLREVADPGDPVTDPSVALDDRLAEIRRRAELGDGRTRRGLEAVGTSLGLGAGVLVNLFNPRVIVLGGYFAIVGEFLLGAVEAELSKRVVVPGSASCRVELSTLGFMAACRGSAHVALEAVLADPTSITRAVPADLPGGTR